MNDVRASSSREETFASLLAANRRRLQAIARSYAWGGAEQDLFQEILLQLWRSLDRFEGRSSLDTWAYRVALNTAMIGLKLATTSAPVNPKKIAAVGHHSWAKVWPSGTARPPVQI